MTYFLPNNNDDLKAVCGISDAELGIIFSRLPDFSFIRKTKAKYEKDIRQKNVKLKYQSNLPVWLDRYNKIKDPNWPDCQCYEDFSKLEDWQKKECIEVHKFSPDIWYQEIKKDELASDSQELDLRTVVKYKSILLDHLYIIQGKNILDVGCHDGGLAATCLINGARYVRSMDIRDENLSMTGQLKSFLKYKNWDVEKCDLYDRVKLAEHCSNINTVLLAGVIYHVQDHLGLLESLTCHRPDHMIIETSEDKSIMDHDNALVSWKVENTLDLVAGWHQDHEKILVGYPNRAWLDMAMTNLGYQRINQTRYHSWHGPSYKHETHRYRTVYVYQKIVG